MSALSVKPEAEQDTVFISLHLACVLTHFEMKTQTCI